ncbi:MAG: dUTP diphosphatase [Gemmatimonadota bacterium]
MTHPDESPLEVRFKRLPGNPDLALPERATTGAAGHDIRSAETEVILEPGVPRAVRTGLAVEISSGIECQVRPRSGLALRRAVIVANAPGTIDSDYRGEVKVILLNLGREPVRIARGERIAQLVFARYEAPRVTEVTEISDTERGVGGFGSTGRD